MRYYSINYKLKVSKTIRVSKETGQHTVNSTPIKNAKTKTLHSNTNTEIDVIDWSKAAQIPKLNHVILPLSTKSNSEAAGSQIQCKTVEQFNELQKKHNACPDEQAKKILKVLAA